MCRSKTPGRALSRPTLTGFLSLCLRPKRAVWEWDSRSANQSSKPMAVEFGCPPGQTEDRFSSLNCRWQLARNKQPEVVRSVTALWDLMRIYLGHLGMSAVGT